MPGRVVAAVVIAAEVAATGGPAAAWRRTVAEARCCQGRGGWAAAGTASPHPRFVEDDVAGDETLARDRVEETVSLDSGRCADVDVRPTTRRVLARLGSPRTLKVAVYDAKELICSVAGTGKGEARYRAGGTGVADTTRQGELLGSADNGVGECCSAVTAGMAETTMPESVNVRL